MFTYAFWRGVIERGVKTFAQALLTMFLAAGVASLFEIDYKAALGVAGLQVVLSILTSIVSVPFSVEGSPSMVRDVPSLDSGYVGRHRSADDFVE